MAPAEADNPIRLDMAEDAQPRPPNRGKIMRKLKYAANCLAPYVWQRITRHPVGGPVHLIITLADHFEPSSMTGAGSGYAPHDVQEKRLETWCNGYPRNFEPFRDHDGHFFNHTYFYPAEQYDRGLVQRLAEFCHSGWGEIEIHLHHGITKPANAENTREQLVSFRDTLANDFGCLSYAERDNVPKYAFIHGNFTLANCAKGYACGVDSEMQLLADTGCYVDMTYPTSAFHPAQIAKINSVYECSLPLHRAAPQRRGRQLQAGRPISIFPFIVLGPWMLDFDRDARNGFGKVENGALTAANPPSLRRLRLWKEAYITVAGRPDWLFLKLHTHGMAPADTDTLLRGPMQQFLQELIEGAPQRGEILHFTSAREMANILMAACDGREGNPGNYRDYRYKLAKTGARAHANSVEVVQKN
jgi:hypothetical protein